MDVTATTNVSLRRKAYDTQCLCVLFQRLSYNFVVIQTKNSTNNNKNNNDNNDDDNNNIMIINNNNFKYKRSQITMIR